MPKGEKKERELPKVGTTFIRNYNDNEYVLTVVEDDKKIKYKLGGKIFDSPTAAAKSLIVKKREVNGWVFWGMKNY